ncbi:hypothetical protein Y170_14830 [Listeria monocytogenes]|nr:hypothetical protein [Listeria monocytogenes]
MKKIANDTFSVFGIVFVVLLIASYFLQIGEIIEDARVFLLIFFVLNILGKYLLKQKREKKQSMRRL